MTPKNFTLKLFFYCHSVIDIIEFARFYHFQKSMKQFTLLVFEFNTKSYVDMLILFYIQRNDIQQINDD